jgi:thiol-disulfide isomerase/thioredoxin
MDVQPVVNIRKNAPFILLGLGLALIGASAFYILRGLPAQADSLTVIPVEVDFPAPGLTLTGIDGVIHSLMEYRGRVVLVNLWATWCEPCKKEMPTLQAFHERHFDDGFTVIAVNDGDPIADVLQFVKDFKLTFPVWLDPTYTATEQAFKTLGLPSSYVIDRSGTVRLQWVGGIDRRTLEKFVTPIIKEDS